MSRACSAKTKILVDTVVGLEGGPGKGILKSGRRIEVIKVNAQEVLSITRGLARDDEPTERYPLIKSRAGRFLLENPNVGSLAVTAGPKEAYLFMLVSAPDPTPASQPPSGQRLLVSYRYKIPEVPDGEMGSPIGAGDTCAAVTLAVLVGAPGFDVPGAFAWGLAAATASCYSEENAVGSGHSSRVGVVVS
jgi:sugar/nucleoside kinase (ribokinase family)